ncbi:MAG: HAD family hydrolase [Eubacteriales bacterium]|nr:HAD family hydrolase [Eubacteriales bacterium]
MAFRACVWDLDGTLFYTLPTIHHYCNASLRHFGFHEISLDECRDLCRLSIAHFYHRLLELGGCPADEIERLSPRIRDYDCESYLADFAYLTEPYEGIRETLAALQSKGIRNGVLTNKPDAIARSLVERFLGGLIDVCVGQTPDSISKPDPRSMDGVLNALSVSRGEVLYVGDTDVDMQTAKNTRVAAAAALWGYQPIEALAPYAPAFVVRAPAELIPLF